MISCRIVLCIFGAVGASFAAFDSALEAASIRALAARPHLTARQSGNKNNNRNSAQQRAAQQRQQQQDRAAAAARLDRARKLLAATANIAGASQFRYQAFAGKAEAAKGNLYTSKEAGEAATEEMRQIESEIESAQADDSPYAKSLDEAEAAATAFKALREKIENSASYREAKAAAIAGANKIEKLNEVEQRFFTANPEYIQARSGADLMVARFREIRQTLFAEDGRWQTAAQAAKDARSQATEAAKQLQGSLLRKAGAADDAREAAAAAQAAADLVKLREAQAKAVGSPKGNKKGSKKGQGSNSKKN